MFIMSYIAVGTWTFFAFIMVLFYMYMFVKNPSMGNIIFSLIGLLINGFILYAGITNIYDIYECSEKK